MFESDSVEKLFKDNYDALCMFSLHYVGDIFMAEDIVMDCFLKFSEREERGEHIVAPKHYLYQMVKNRSLDTMKQHTPIYNKEYFALQDAMETQENVDELTERSEREAKLWRLIDNLSPIRRKVLLMSKRDGMHNQEIAASLGISVRTVEAHLYKTYCILRGKARELYTLIFF